MSEDGEELAAGERPTCRPPVLQRSQDVDAPSLDVPPLQRDADVEQVLDVPVLHTDDSRVDLALDAFREAAEAAENVRMDWLEHQILTGAPVSAADRAAWRRWANRKKRKKRRKKKLPNTSSSHSSSPEVCMWALELCVKECWAGLHAGVLLLREHGLRSMVGGGGTDGSVQTSMVALLVFPKTSVCQDISCAPVLLFRR